jgi:glycosyltransferase involved in cell wall biosynthesis
VLIVPARAGSGMRVKILEAFARGLPVVSTTIGAEGIDVRHDEHLLIADSPADIAAAVARLLERPDEAARLARAGRALVETRYDWRTALGGLDSIYTDRPSTAVPAGPTPLTDAPSRNA